MGSISTPLLPGYLACVPLSCFPNGKHGKHCASQKKGSFLGWFVGKCHGKNPSSNKLRSSAAGKHILSAAAKKFGFKASGPE